MSLVPIAAASIDHTAIYWPVAWITLTLSLFASFGPRSLLEKRPVLARWLYHPFTFFLGIAVTLIAFRWPGVVYPFTLNADESQLLAQAITLANDGLLDIIVFYDSVQSGSAGPLLTYPLLLPSFFGLEINYASGRVVGLLLLWIACIVLYYTVRPLTGELAARVATWVAGLCFALSHKPDFVHYTSEHPSLPLLALCTLLFFSLLDGHTRFLRMRLVLLGAALAAVPFAKLQSTIIALTIAGLAYLVILRAADIDLKDKLKRCAFLTAGGIFVPALFFSIYASAGVFDYFWQVYIVNNYHYKEAGETFYESFAFYMGSPKARQVNYEIFFCAAAAFIGIRLAWWIIDREHRAERPWRPLFFAAILVAASWFAVVAPGRGFPHYLLLTVLPVSLVCGILMSDRRGEDVGTEDEGEGASLSFWKKLVQGRNLAVPCLFFPLLIWAARPAYFRVNQGYLTMEYFLENFDRYEELPLTKAAQIIRRTRKPGERLTVWGWRADYHVETQAPMGTRSACPEFQIRRVPLRDFYRKTALQEFRRHRPTFVIDAVGELSLNFDDHRLFGLQIFPELANVIRANYVLAGDFPYDRLFIRKDRYEEVLEELKRQASLKKAVADSAESAED